MATVTAKYVCECREGFDEDTGASEGLQECIGCAADSGYCECTCDCGQCRYTTQPCDFQPPEQPCEFCLIRKDWEVLVEEDPLSEVRPMIAKVDIKITQAKDDLATAEVPGNFSHEYLRQRLGQRLEPCLKALLLVEDKSPWSSSVIDEVKNILGLEGKKDIRKYCGIPNCGCHLRILNALLCEKAGHEFKRLNGQIVSGEDLMHLTERGVAKFLEALDSAKFQKRIADEMVEEFIWEMEADPSYGTPEELKGLRETLKEKQIAENEADAAYTAARAYFTAAYNSYRRLQAENGIGPN